MVVKYWEMYDDQDGKDFDYVNYTNIAGEDVTEAISEDLEKQVNEIRRLNGSDTAVKLLRV